jgi:hypothetical protein
MKRLGVKNQCVKKSEKEDKCIQSYVKVPNSVTEEVSDKKENKKESLHILRKFGNFLGVR